MDDSVLNLLRDDLNDSYDPDEDVEEESQDNSNYDSGAEATGQKDENPAESSGRSEKGKSPVKVQFSDVEGPSPPPGVDLEEASRLELIAKLGGLQERLTQTQVSLKQEKSNRRRKEKNIYKMAKELSNRQAEAKQKEEDVLKVSRHFGSGGFALRDGISYLYCPFPSP